MVKIASENYTGKKETVDFNKNNYFRQKSTNEIYNHIELIKRLNLFFNKKEIEKIIKKNYEAVNYER